MKNLKAKLIALTGSLLLAACGDDRFPDYRYKMTIYVGDQAFSSVREVRQEEGSSIQSSSGKTLKTELTGEAVIIDLPSGKTVYALLARPDSADYGKYIAAAALTASLPKFTGDKAGDSLADNAYQAQQMVEVLGPRELPRTRPSPDPVRQPEPVKLWPFFVTFDDPTNPTTMREVSADNIGVQRITIEITDEDTTTGIDKRLPRP